MIEKRIARLRESLEARVCDWFIVTPGPHVRYLTGFTGTNGMCVFSKSDQWFLTDFRYKEQAQEEVSQYTIRYGSRNLFEELANLRLISVGDKTGVEGAGLLYLDAEQLRERVAGENLEIMQDVVPKLAAIKDAAEIDLLAQAAERTDKTFQDVLPYIKPGVTEREIAAELSYRLRKHGCERDAFDFIVASGLRSALPHGVASDKVIENHDLVTLDFGGVYRGYHADITRTVMVGEPSSIQREIYAVVLSAQQKALAAAAAGVPCQKLDAIAREEITERGYGEYFGHSLGHGIGLQIHEGPRLASTQKGDLQPGHVVTIEPGVYLPEVGGVRIEDDIVIEESGARLLTHTPKELLIL